MTNTTPSASATEMPVTERVARSWPGADAARPAVDRARDDGVRTDTNPKNYR
jgi:hypothetical protein